MKILLSILTLGVLALAIAGCGQADTADNKEAAVVDRQQKIYLETQPVHIYDYSIPRDMYQQIYDITTTKVVATYSVIESVTGVTRYHCPSMGYAMQADRSLTNPLKGAHNIDGTGADEFSVVVEQAEPDGLFSSKNTDATWVLCVELGTGEAYPVYSEHKVMTFPFIVEKNSDEEWVRADNSPLNFTVEVRTAPVKPAEEKDATPDVK